MKVMYKVVTAATFSLATLILSTQSYAVETLGGGGNTAEKLLLDWAKAKLGNKTNTVKFSTSIASGDLSMVQNGKIDFAILDAPLSDAELNQMNLLQVPFALSGVSIVVNLPNTMAGALRLDSQTLGKIFSGEISQWDDPAITALNPKHDLPKVPIVIVHSGDNSTDFPVLNSYLGFISEKWRAGELNGKKRGWPANAIFADGFTARIAALKSTPYTIGYLPMQYMQQPVVSAVHLKNRDGNFGGLSDTGIIAATSTVNIEDGHAASLSLINKSGNASWPISSFAFVVVSKDRLKDERVAQLLSVISYGLKSGSLKTTLHNYIAIPDQISKSIMEKIDAINSGANTASATRIAPVKAGNDSAQEVLANKKRSEEELSRQRADVTQDENRRAEERSRAAKQQADEIAREQAIKEAKAAKLAAEEAIKAAQAAKLEADKLAEKNRQIAKLEKERADKEKADKDRADKERADKEKAIELRNQKDEDPLEAYRRTVQ